MPLERHAPTLPGRAVIEQRWNRAVFVHWRVDPDEVAPLLPAGTRPDVHDGAAWVGLVPFVLSEFRFLPLPPVPFVGTFTEINVRTYAVDDAGRRGVVFRTLEAEHLAPVLAARALFGLPYRWARAGVRTDGPLIEYRSRRHGGLRAPASGRTSAPPPSTPRCRGSSPRAGGSTNGTSVARSGPRTATSRGRW